MKPLMKMCAINKDLFLDVSCIGNNYQFFRPSEKLGSVAERSKALV
jgi:hypothetical protein